jgi:hypothetical protein
VFRAGAAYNYAIVTRLRPPLPMTSTKDAGHGGVKERGVLRGRQSRDRKDAEGEEEGELVGHSGATRGAA